MVFLGSLFYFIILISILVIIHEFGHFIAARLTGMRAEIFSVGMGKRLFGYNKVSGFTLGKLPKNFDGGDHTDYRVSLLPLGGFLKISGMIDESFDTDFEGGPPQPYEFRSKNTMQKTFAITAGVIMNFLLAFILFSALIYFNGRSHFSTTEIGYIKKNTSAEKSGFKSGDRIISVDGKKVSDWIGLSQAIAFKNFGDKKKVELVRNDQKINLEVDGKTIVRSIADKESRGYMILGLIPSHIKMIFGDGVSGRPSGKLGLKQGDTALAVNGEPINSIYEFIAILQDNRNKPCKFTWSRNGKIMSGIATPDKDGKIGIPVEDVYTGSFKVQKYSAAEALVYGFNEVENSIELLFESVAEMIKGTLSVKESVGGPIAIAKGAYVQAQRGLSDFLNFMAILSVYLAVVNIFPFPALDGGHLVFILLEGALRREVSVKIKMVFQQAGTIILMILFALIIYNDIVR